MKEIEPYWTECARCKKVMVLTLNDQDYCKACLREQLLEIERACGHRFEKINGHSRAELFDDTKEK